MSGIIYLPVATLVLSGGATTQTNIVVNKLNISGGAVLDIQGYDGPGWSSVTDALTE